MKKIFKLFVSIFMILVLVPIQGVFAADGSVSISGPSQLEPGESASYTISFYADDTAFFEYSISGVNISASGSGIAGDGESNSSSVTITATAGPAGYSTIYVDVTIATTGSSVSEFSRSTSKPVLIETAPVAPTPELTPPTETPGGSNNSGNENTPPKPTPEEEAAAKEAEELAAKELAQKTPLIKTIDVLSMSPKKYNQSVVNTVPKEDTWAYDFALPKRIDKFSLLITGVDSDVVITFDKEHEFKEGDPVTKEIAVRAVKGDIIQEYTIKITKDISVPEVVELDGKKISVFEDDELDDFMKAAGFERKTYPGSNKAAISYFSFDKVNIQLMLNEKNEAQWHLLSSDNKIGEVVSLQFDADKKPFFVLNAPDEVATEVLRGNKYETVSGKVDDILLNLDSEIKWVNDYKAWALDDGQVVYGMSGDGIRDTFKRTTEGKSILAVVSFDAKASNSMKTLAIASTTGFVALGAYLLATTMMNVRKRKLELESEGNLADSNNVSDPDNSVNLDGSDEHDDTEKTL